MCVKGPWYKYVLLLLEFGTVGEEYHMLPKPWRKSDYKFAKETVDIEMPRINYSHTWCHPSYYSPPYENKVGLALECLQLASFESKPNTVKIGTYSTT